MLHEIWPDSDNDGDGDGIIMVGDVEAESHDDNDDHDEDDEEENEDDEIDIENVEKFIRTFHTSDYDDEFDDMLSADRSDIVPDRPTQASYIKPDDWRERNRIGVEKVRGQLRTCISSAINHHIVNLDLRHNSKFDVHELMDNEEPIVWHESVLDEYWNHLSAAIDRTRQLGIVTNSEVILTENVEIKKERLDALVAIFFNRRAANSSRRVAFVNANICGEGIICLSKLVDVSSELQVFCLRHNRIDHMESARCLSRSLKSHTCINHLDLEHCDLGSNLEILLIILQSDVKGINLSNNNIDTLGAVRIAEYLEGNPPIEEFGLDHNQLNDDDAVLISQALKRNTNLHQINLRSNNFTSIGVKALLTCVFDASSLNAISESNHTLLNLFMFSGQVSGNLTGCIDRLLDLDRTQKILLALKDKNSLLQYLANVPVELIPEVLVFPFQHVGGHSLHTHLNIIYSTMRWWNMPMLYSYHQCVKSDAKRKRAD
jgi:hypothetical protein